MSDSTATFVKKETKKIAFYSFVYKYPYKYYIASRRKFTLTSKFQFQSEIVVM